MLPQNAIGWYVAEEAVNWRRTKNEVKQLLPIPKQRLVFASGITVLVKIVLPRWLSSAHNWRIRPAWQSGLSSFVSS